MSPRQKHEVIRDLADRHLPEQDPLIDKLGSEFDWIHDQGLRTWEGYRDADRKGRGFRLSATQREIVWTACLEWRDYLDRTRAGDFPHFGFRFHAALSDGLEPTVRYDSILIDEAQFFAPIWFDIARRHLKPEGALFLCADPSQGFLRQGISWNSVGLSVRGRAERLNWSYRTTRPILQFAWSFLQARAPEIAEETVVPDLERMEDGMAPDLLLQPDLDGQIRTCVQDISQAIGEGFEPRDFLVLVLDKSIQDDFVKRLQDHSIPTFPADSEHSENAVRVCTLEKATGLEAPVVHLLGISQLLEAEENPMLDDEERELLKIRHARQLYMGFTRAGSMLRIGWSGPVPMELQSLLSGP